MNRPLTLASLFDGSGGFPLAGLLSGIEPLWASEVEPFPIRVTTKRLPQVRHLGDVNKIDGAAVPPVDVITAGFCCQDLSISGKRAGLHGERSDLFFQIIRIVKEMRAATENLFPRFTVLENVPGMYSSASGADYLEVLNELVKVKDETLSVPMPEKGKWSTAGEIVGDGFSLAWRTFDSQFWGVPQRRRRCYIVVDFAGESAGELLFDESRLRGNPPPRFFTREGAAGDPEDSLRGAIAFEPGACSRLGGHTWETVGTLRADMGDNQTAVVYDARGNGNGEVANTITGDHNGHISDYTTLAVEPQTLKIRAGKPGGGKGAILTRNLSATLSTSNDQSVFVPAAFGISSFDSEGMKSSNPNTGIYKADTSRTLDCGGGRPDNHQGGIAVVSYAMAMGMKMQVCEEKAPTLMARDYKDPPAVARPQYVVRRLTPDECALLQGFPPWWCDGLETPEPTEDDIAVWADIWETHRLIAGTSSRPKSKKQIIKWLRAPHSDSAEYKMWGNGISLPVAAFVLGGIEYYGGGDHAESARPRPGQSPRDVGDLGGKA